MTSLFENINNNLRIKKQTVAMLAKTKIAQLRSWLALAQHIQHNIELRQIIWHSIDSNKILMNCFNELLMNEQLDTEQLFHYHC